MRWYFGIWYEFSSYKLKEKGVALRVKGESGKINAGRSGQRGMGGLEKLNQVSGLWKLRANSVTRTAYIAKLLALSDPTG